MKAKFNLGVALIAMVMCFSSCCTVKRMGYSMATIGGKPGTEISNVITKDYLGQIDDDGYGTIKLKNSSSSARILLTDPSGSRSIMSLEPSFDADVFWNIFFAPGFIVDFATGNCYNFDGIYGGHRATRHSESKPIVVTTTTTTTVVK